MHAASPRIDIYLPTYRPKAAHIQPSIDSIFAQSEQNWHLWINNQVTEIEIEPLIAEYLKDPRVTLNHNHEHPGIGANWNDCLQYGSAPVVQYMFDDDVWGPEYLAAGLKVLNEHADVGMVSLGHEYLFQDEVPTKNSYTELTEFLKAEVRPSNHEGSEFLFWWFERGLHPNVIGEPMFVMLRRSVIDDVGRFREDMRQNLDSEYWARVLAKTNWYYQPGNYGSFRVHSAAASAQNFAAGRGMFDRLRMLKTILPLLPKDKQPAAKRSMRKHTGKMMEKLVERYGSARRIHYRDGESLIVFCLRNVVPLAQSSLYFVMRKILKR